MMVVKRIKWIVVCIAVLVVTNSVSCFASETATVIMKEDVAEAQQFEKKIIAIGSDKSLSNKEKKKKIQSLAKDTDENTIAVFALLELDEAYSILKRVECGDITDYNENVEKKIEYNNDTDTTIETTKIILDTGGILVQEIIDAPDEQYVAFKGTVVNQDYGDRVYTATHTYKNPTVAGQERFYLVLKYGYNVSKANGLKYNYVSTAGTSLSFAEDKSALTSSCKAIKKNAPNVGNYISAQGDYVIKYKDGVDRYYQRNFSIVSKIKVLYKYSDRRFIKVDQTCEVIK